MHSFQVPFYIFEERFFPGNALALKFRLLGSTSCPSIKSACMMQTGTSGLLLFPYFPFIQTCLFKTCHDQMTRTQSPLSLIPSSSFCSIFSSLPSYIPFQSPDSHSNEGNPFIVQRHSNPENGGVGHVYLGYVQMSSLYVTTVSQILVSFLSKCFKNPCIIHKYTFSRQEHVFAFITQLHLTHHVTQLKHALTYMCNVHCSCSVYVFKMND